MAEGVAVVTANTVVATSRWNVVAWYDGRRKDDGEVLSVLQQKLIMTPKEWDPLLSDVHFRVSEAESSQLPHPLVPLFFAFSSVGILTSDATLCT